MVEQISLASSDYARGVDEFLKAGFTKRASEAIAPPSVAESPFAMECRLLQYVDTGGKPGSGNLMIGEVVRMHISEEVFDGEVIDPRKLDLVARMGYNWYCRANGEALFELAKPSHNGIGFDRLPEHLLRSTLLTGNELARLASVEQLPDAATVQQRWTEALHMDDPRLPGKQPEALSTLLREWKAGNLQVHEIANALIECVRTTLSTENMEFAWECAIMANTQAITAVSVKHSQQHEN
jgi:hypothetical protein